jgi:integrase/recombinase XerC
VQAYRSDLDQFHDFLTDTFEIDDDVQVQHVHLRSWIVELVETGMNAKSVNRKIACLKSYFKFLNARRLINSNPASRIKPLKTEQKLPSFVKENEMTRLLDQVEFSADFPGQRDKVIIELFYSSGIRLSELIGITEADLNLNEPSVKVLGKRNKERIIPLPDSIVRTIRNYLVLKKEKWQDPQLILTDHGESLYPMFVYRVIKKYLAMVTTLSKKSPHVLRHTFATHLLDKGADLNAVKDLLGHSSLAATQVYTHNSLEKLKSTFDQAHPKA